MYFQFLSKKWRLWWQKWRIFSEKWRLFRAGLHRQELDYLIDKVMIFKTHFAALDIRQDNSIHRRTVEAILRKAGKITTDLKELEPELLIEMLLFGDIQASAQDFDDPLLQDTILNISQL